MGLHNRLISGLIVTGTDMPSLLLPGLLIKSDPGSRAWIRIEGRRVRDSDPHSQLEHTSNHRDMDSQYTTVDQLAVITDTMASLRDAILGLGQRIDGHQATPLPISGITPHDSTPPPPPPPPPSSGPTIQQDYTVPPPPPPPLSGPTVQQDYTVPPPPPPLVQSAPQVGAFVLHGQTETMPHSVVTPAPIIDDTLARIDRTEDQVSACF